MRWMRRTQAPRARGSHPRHLSQNGLSQNGYGQNTACLVLFCFEGRREGAGVEARFGATVRAQSAINKQCKRHKDTPQPRHEWTLCAWSRASKHACEPCKAPCNNCAHAHVQQQKHTPKIFVMPRRGTSLRHLSLTELGSDFSFKGTPDAQLPWLCSPLAP